KVNPYRVPRHDLRPTLTRRRNNIATLLKVIGLLLIVCCMPTDFLGGHGRGFLADPDHFQGYEVFSVVCVFAPIVGVPLTITMIFVSLAAFGYFDGMPRTTRAMALSGGIAVSLLSCVLL